MDEAREFKHVCKFCSKRFPCGRSLGGHMRSHMITITEPTEQLARKKIPSVNDTETNGYGLRENPKKSKRIADHSSAVTSQNNGMSFVSEKERVPNQDSRASSNQKLVTDSQSDTETVTPNRKRRSKTRKLRYIAAATTSNSCPFSVADNNNNNDNNNNGYEQEELAMCLMMLSRDVGSRGVLNSVAESSDNNSVFLEPKIEFKKLNYSEHKSISKKKIRDSYDLELRTDSLRRSITTDVSDGEFYKDSQTRSKFECATCNKIFHSYQALGGHRASHKKIKACFGSKIESSDNSIEAEGSLDRTADSNKQIKSINNENYADHCFAADCDDSNRVDTSYGVKKRHECPICLRVFPSGQALGGHKRSHLVGGKEARNNPTIVIENPIPEIRNFLDLNLPAPGEENSNGHLGLQQWWIRRSHKHEALVGLISN